MPNTPTDHTLTRADGRRIAWAEWGDPRGAPGGVPSSQPWLQVARPRSCCDRCPRPRLITLDRPGYGGTDPLVDPTRAAVASDVAAVIDDSEVDDVAVVGWSGGPL